MNCSLSNTIASVDLTIGCSSSDFASNCLSSNGSASSGLSSSDYSSSVGTDTGGNLTVSEVVSKLGI